MAVILNTKGTTETEFRLSRDGATIKTGSGAPGALAGNLSDIYLDYTNGTMYIMEAGGWTKITTVATNNDYALANLSTNLLYRHSLVTATTTDATLTYLIRPDNIPGQTTHLELPNNASVAFDVEVIGRQTGALQVAQYHFKGLLNTSGNLGTFVQTPTGANHVQEIINESNAEWYADMATGVANGNATLQVGVAGAGGATIQWLANVKQTINVLI
tara:strand:+ start:2641 stop:3288 length:648 start_codon:yes stop_codon:yes gene_type:complete